MKHIRCLLFLLASFFVLHSSFPVDFSTAGFYALPESGREVHSMNPAWRFFCGEVQGAEARDFVDSAWTMVSLPHGIEYLPTEASGCTNYQGPVWYRKHFSVPSGLQGKKLFLHFEAIMGKSRIYLNGHLLGEHFGGYLPIVLDATEHIDWEGENVLAVWADNSNDPFYPPGKAQELLDFAYFGGIYRDVWMVTHSHTYITDPNHEDVQAGGGLFVSYDRVSRESAQVRLKLHVRNDGEKRFAGRVEFELVQPDGKRAALVRQKLSVGSNAAATAEKVVTLKNPHLWSPDEPQLYNLIVRIRDSKGRVVDGYRQRIGIRSFEFRGQDGFYLNGRPYPHPLIGANRHQEFAVLGNAVPNSLHWRDAKKLRDAGLRVIRNAHCPQDPAFMDTCDELGLLVINNTPGWQFWNPDPIFAQRIYSDIRNLVRRDRNHACQWLWEPVLNETRYPIEFGELAQRTVREEYPYASCYSSCEANALGHEHYTVHFEHPAESARLMQKDSTRCYFTREWGDNVDSWASHNSPSRVARQWGEHAMLVQAQHYACPPYSHTSYDALFRTSRQHIGGCLWHSFDHQRGYHPDPFYGGIMDVFRQPKYSYYMFQAQRPLNVEAHGNASNTQEGVGSGPMVYIAHEMTPFSPKDVTVYSNCPEVRLTYNKGGKVYTYTRPTQAEGMPSPVVTFPGVYDFMIDKKMTMYQHRQDEVYLLAEGLVDGRVVARHEVRPARRPERLLLWVDNENLNLRADGSDAVVVVAAVADAAGNIKHLNNQYIHFSIEGEGRILGGADIFANPAPVKWGTAPVLVQSTLTPGIIKITASVLFEGNQMPVSATLKLQSQPASHPLIYLQAEAALIPIKQAEGIASRTAVDPEEERRQSELNRLRLREVELQQADFGEAK